MEGDNTAVEGTELPPAPAEPEPSAFEQKLSAMQAALEDDPDIPLEQLRAAGGVPDKPRGSPETPEEGEEDPTPPEPKAAEAGEEEEGEEATSDEGKKPDKAAEAEEGEEEEGDGVVHVRLPGRREEDDDVEFDLPHEVLEELGLEPEEVSARLNQMRNGYARSSRLAEQARELEAAQAELSEVEEALTDDPVTFLTERIEDDKLRRQVAEALILQMDDDELGDVLDRVGAWSRDPDARETARIRAENEALKKASQRKSKSNERARATDEAKKIGEQITSVIPGDWPLARQQALFDFAVKQLRVHLVENELESLDPADVVKVLGERGVLEAHGLNGEASGTPPGDQPASGEEKPGSSKKAAEGKKKKHPKDRAASRKAATTTPAGAGAEAATGLNLPKGQAFKDRIATLAKSWGVPTPKGFDDL